VGVDSDCVKKSDRIGCIQIVDMHTSRAARKAGSLSMVSLVLPYDWCRSLLLMPFLRVCSAKRQKVCAHRKGSKLQIIYLQLDGRAYSGQTTVESAPRFTVCPRKLWGYLDTAVPYADPWRVSGLGESPDTRTS
jgi:hypothetical protein